MSKLNDQQNDKYVFNLGSWYFAPRFKLTVLTILLLLILVYLGGWQLGRGLEKQNISKNIKSQVHAQPEQLLDLKEPTLEKNRFMPITVEGLYLNNYTILIDNQMRDHKAGYRVITPMHVPHAANWLLVDRGWIAAGADRTQLPKVDLIFGLKKVTGTINTISSGIVLQADKANDQIKWPIVLQNLNYELITTQLHHPIYDFTLQLNANEPGSYAVNKLDYGMSSARHYGYAMVWFTLSYILLMYYIIISTTRRR